MLLAIETSTRTGSLALVDGDVIVAHRVLDQKERHGALLAPAVAALEGLDLERVSAFALGIGPGSFTGLRIGLAFVKGLALAYPRPAIAVSTLELLATGALLARPSAERALAFLDARRSEAYAALFRRPTELGAVTGLALPKLVPDPGLPEAAYGVPRIAPLVRAALEGGEGALVAVGDGAGLDHGPDVPWAVVDDALWTPDARVLARLALGRLIEGVDVQDLEPRYHQLSPAEANALAAMAPARGQSGEGS